MTRRQVNDLMYDAWNRLVEINEDGTSNPVANYEYDALGWRISAVHDTDDDDLLNDEITEHYVYDRSWRQVGMFEEAETSATITWVHHNGKKRCQEPFVLAQISPGRIPVRRCTRTISAITGGI